MKTLLLLVSVVFSTLLFGQELLTTSDITVSKSIPVNNWTTYFESVDLRIEYKKLDCDPNSGMDYQAIHFRFSNLSSETVELSWHLELEYDGTCKTCGFDEYKRSLSLAPGEVKQGDCDVNTNRTLDLFVKFIDAAYSKGAELTSFKLSDLSMD
jgi:hypothetical protein